MQIDEQQVRAFQQCLADAGCNEDIIKRCMDSLQRNDSATVIRLLSKRRNELLTQIHGEQKQLDCLDYFVYKIRKEKYKEIKSWTNN